MIPIILFGILLIISFIFTACFIFYSDCRYFIIALIWVIVFGSLTGGLSYSAANNLDNEKDDFTYKITVPKGENSRSYYTNNIEEMGDGVICISDYYIVYGFPKYELTHKTRTLKLNGYILEGYNNCD